MGSTLSVIASIALIRGTCHDLFPEELRCLLRNFSSRFSSELTMIIQDTHEGSSNHLFSAATSYLGSKALSAISSSIPRRLTAGRNESVRTLTFGLDRNSEVVDNYNGMPMKWRYNSDFNSTLNMDIEWYELTFDKKHVDIVETQYLCHIIDEAKRIKDQNRVLKLYTARSDRWNPTGITFDHPMTFDTLALDEDLIKRIIDDLDRFVNGKEYYKRIGKVRKRGYLLYGPPGTGKSSLIAAMANYLNFDIYNLNLSDISSDSSLEYLSLHVSNRSILVLEDIDCSIMLQNGEIEHPPGAIFMNKHAITFGGLLNVIDGLLSCCGDERIIVITTNHKERIDAALLRPGRMDIHICLSYCSFSMFKQLASNYLQISNHDLFGKIEKLIGEVQATPAEIAGELIDGNDPKNCLEGLIRFLESKESNAQPLNAPILASNLVENKPENEGHGQNSYKMTDLEDDVITNNNDEVKLGAAEFTSKTEVGEYIIKTESVAILRAVMLKHGDVAGNTFSYSVQYRASLLEIVCRIILELHAIDLRDVTEAQVKSLLTTVEDLESVGLEVDWLHQRLVLINEAIKLGENGSTPTQDMSENVQDIRETDLETKLLASEEDGLVLQEKCTHIEDKLVKLKAASDKLLETISNPEAQQSSNCSFHTSLVDGLL
ncbi:AAA domain-containing protein/PEARLI-4 domain-containing protein/AAA_assoc domain-containing protein [Cephalotus follicularis]|uniref:AAA domain-containing protein/PEARLI-4 domain-containing protein/AAA_assoc domain-containing protein n=1 Tax=Cephalotus follicularis TaxID=3775 RepID=A0A1Q3C2G2_CEPFO|nr:AAA domain-containing protein/PEARLI-4 domain-containing protein/AAA_assoc domain-containing protein [Cephalotus follicularis]